MQIYTGCCYDSVEAKDVYITKKIERAIYKIFQEPKQRKTLTLTRNISDRKVFGGDGEDRYKTLFLGQARQKFEPWRVLHALDHDSMCGIFSIVEIMRDIEGLEKYNRFCFHGKSAMSRVTNVLEIYVEGLCPL